MRKHCLIRSTMFLVGAAVLGAAGLRAQAPANSDSTAPVVRGNATSSHFSRAALGAAKRYVESGNLPGAISYLVEALRMQEAAGVDPILRIPILLELEDLYTGAKDESGRELTLRRTLDTWTTAFGPDDLVVANSAEKLASVLSKEGKHEQAAQFWDQALRIIRTALGPNHSATEHALTKLIDEETKREAISPSETTRLRDLRAELQQVRAAREAEHASMKAEQVGKGVSAPTIIKKKSPQYSHLAQKRRLCGMVLLSLVVGADGKPEQIEVLFPLGLGLDEAAVEAAREWVFRPGMKDGVAVPMNATIEVNFRLL